MEGKGMEEGEVKTGKWGRDRKGCLEPKSAKQCGAVRFSGHMQALHRYTSQRTKYLRTLRLDRAPRRPNDHLPKVLPTLQSLLALPLAIDHHAVAHGFILKSIADSDAVTEFCLGGRRRTDCTCEPRSAVQGHTSKYCWLDVEQYLLLLRMHHIANFLLAVKCSSDFKRSNLFVPVSKDKTRDYSLTKSDTVISKVICHPAASSARCVVHRVLKHTLFMAGLSCCNQFQSPLRSSLLAVCGAAHNERLRISMSASRADRCPIAVWFVGVRAPPRR
eukprot:2690285-Pleurochrysis_carterae.AAC.1